SRASGQAGGRAGSSNSGQQQVNASNWSAAVARHSAGIASAISGFSGGAATRREGGSEGTVSASAWGRSNSGFSGGADTRLEGGSGGTGCASTVWRAERVVPRPQYSSFFGFPGRPGYQHSRPSMMR